MSKTKVSLQPHEEIPSEELPRNAARTIPAEDIALRAYELYLARGAEDGYDVVDWLQAEQDIVRDMNPSEGENGDK